MKDKEIIKGIIKNKSIYPVYQPIINLSDNSIYGFEALTIVKYDMDFNIEKLFSLSEKYGMVWELEELCRKKALKNAINKPANTKLFLNVNPNVLLDKNFESGVTSKFIEKYMLQPDDIVFEITERTPIQSKNLGADFVRFFFYAKPSENFQTLSEGSIREGI